MKFGKLGLSKGLGLVIVYELERGGLAGPCLAKNEREGVGGSVSGHPGCVAGRIRKCTDHQTAAWLKFSKRQSVCL